jgi:hypothetical protein
MANMPGPVRPCHTAQHSVFRSRPFNTTVVGHSLRFALEYEGLGGAWAPVAWRMLVPMHGSSLHLVITSDDGDDYYHVHPQGTGEDGIVTAEVQFRRAGSHLVASSWAVKAEDLDVCVAEHVSHAHSTDNAATYPMITTAWRIEVVDASLPDAKAASAPALPPRRTDVCLKQGVSWNDDRAEALGLVGIDSSYAPGASAACCGACAGEEECAALCTGGGCLRVAAAMKRVSKGWLDGKDWLDEASLPAGECLAVEFEVSRGDGSPATLQPYLGAAAHIFIASAASGEPAGAVQPAVVHAHAYATMDLDSLGGRGPIPDLSRVLCEDVAQSGTYPMAAVPASFGPRLYALVRLPSAGAWRVYVSLRHEDNLATAAFEWHASASPERTAPPPPPPPPSQSPFSEPSAGLAGCRAESGKNGKSGTGAQGDGDIVTWDTASNDMTATYAAVAVSVGVLCLLWLGALGWLWRRRQQRRKGRPDATSSSRAAAPNGSRGASQSVELQGPPIRAEPITHMYTMEAVDAEDAEKC